MSKSSTVRERQVVAKRSDSVSSASPLSSSASSHHPSKVVGRTSGRKFDSNRRCLLDDGRLAGQYLPMAHSHCVGILSLLALFSIV